MPNPATLCDSGDLVRTNAPSKRSRNTNPTFKKGTSCMRVSTMKKSCAAAEREADIVLWDGGNNDIPF